MIRDSQPPRGGSSPSFPPLCIGSQSLVHKLHDHDPPHPPTHTHQEDRLVYFSPSAGHREPDSRAQVRETRWWVRTGVILTAPSCMDAGVPRSQGGWALGSSEFSHCPRLRAGDLWNSDRPEVSKWGIHMGQSQVAQGAECGPGKSKGGLPQSLLPGACPHWGICTMRFSLPSDRRAPGCVYQTSSSEPWNAKQLRLRTRDRDRE